jgi:SAM-dependent methyltransferase
MLGRKEAVFRSERISVTEKIIGSLECKTVLEIGSGDYSFEYVKDNTTVSWVKIDFCEPADIVLDFNKENCRLPCENGAFDLIICTEVLEHLLWPQALLKEAWRLLRPEGCLLVSVPNIASLSYRIAWLLGRIPSCAASGNLPSAYHKTAYERDGSIVGGHVIDFNLSRIIKLLATAHFQPILIKGSGIIWHKQLLPYWMVPSSLASNIIILAGKDALSGDE